MVSAQQPGYPDSYYVATAQGMQERPALDSELTADVCVIGGGFTGLSAALNLAELGMSGEHHARYKASAKNHSVHYFTVWLFFPKW